MYKRQPSKWYILDFVLPTSWAEILFIVIWQRTFTVFTYFCVGVKKTFRIIHGCRLKMCIRDRINTLHGYTTEMDPTKMRDCVIPISDDRKLSLSISTSVSYTHLLTSIAGATSFSTGFVFALLIWMAVLLFLELVVYLSLIHI